MHHIRRMQVGGEGAGVGKTTKRKSESGVTRLLDSMQIATSVRLYGTPISLSHATVTFLDGKSGGPCFSVMHATICMCLPLCYQLNV